MSDLLKKLFGIAPRITFRKVDWLRVEGKIRELDLFAASTDQASAKQLLIQADVLLDSILKEAEVSGATMGERLKKLRDKMPRSTYNGLWQAHIKRNELVHDAGSFVADWEKTKHFEAVKAGISAIRSIR